ncbi:hypothetical protein SAMN06273572_102202 [Monaibacterium marinum]|uniref:Uncharacterized protein n=1 Tax=Pontivivens marinum TaxID=1690039 RepID=A0A2C9CQ99_9RHOB|nr:hypothetical protein [Monaibacterium marinum]SOH93526.1 hypothetical protein SAMN06273572_102202 [Monaibacterium marinum]
MKLTFIALAAAATISATGSFAQGHAAAPMGHGATMLEQLVSNELRALNIDADVSMLTRGELAAVKGHAESGDSTAEIRRNIEQIIH